MKTRVTNTINGDVQVFDNLELANAHVQSEITLGLYKRNIII